MPDIQDLEKRIESLEKEKDSRIRFFMQYLLSPLLLLLIGGFLNFQIEKAKQGFQKIELEIKRIGTTQKFMTELFSGTPQRAFVAERLMSKLVEKEDAEEISKIIAQYYNGQVDKRLSTQKDIEKAQEIKSAAEMVQSPASKELLKNIEKKSYYVIVGSFRDQNGAIKKTEEFRLKGYVKINAIESKSLGMFRVALGDYSFDNANLVRNEVIKKGYAPEDTWIISKEKVAQ